MAAVTVNKKFPCVTGYCLYQRNIIVHTFFVRGVNRNSRDNIFYAKF